MPPKKKAASKSKSALAKQQPAAVDDSPQLVTANFTARRPIAHDSDNGSPGNEDEILLASQKTSSIKDNLTIIIPRVPDAVLKTMIESEPDEWVEEEEIPDKKLVEKKVTKGKSKVKKPTLEDESKVKKRLKRATSVDYEDIKVEEKAVVKSKKRQLDKDIASESSKLPVSPVTDVPKRRQRAASVDTLSKVSKDTEVIEDVSQKKNKKGTKKEEQLKPSDKNTKPKKNNKKVVNESKENSPVPEHDVDELLNNVLDKPKSKKGGKKDKVQTQEEEKVIDDETVVLDKLPGKSRGAAAKAPKAAPATAGSKNIDKKSKNKPKSTLKDSSPELSEDPSGGRDETDDSGSVPSLDLNSKRVVVPKGGKKTESSPDKSEESDGKNDMDGSFVMSPKVKSKRGGVVLKGKNELKETIVKDVKMAPKPRGGGRRAKVEDFDEENPPANNDEFIEIQSEKNEDKPVAAKRKTKAKTGKK